MQEVQSEPVSRDINVVSYPVNEVQDLSIRSRSLAMLKRKLGLVIAVLKVIIVLVILTASILQLLYGNQLNTSPQEK